MASVVKWVLDVVQIDNHLQNFELFFCGVLHGHKQELSHSNQLTAPVMVHVIFKVFTTPPACCFELSSGHSQAREGLCGYSTQPSMPIYRLFRCLGTYLHEMPVGHLDLRHQGHCRGTKHSQCTATTLRLPQSPGSFPTSTSAFLQPQDYPTYCVVLPTQFQSLLFS